LPAKKSKWQKFKARFSRHPQDEPDFRNLLQQARKSGIIDEEALHMIEGVLRVSEKHVRDAMLTRGQMQVIDADATIEEASKIIVDSRHSRFPVVAESRDEIVGILLAKDLLRLIGSDQSKTIAQIIRPATIIPESKRLDSLLQEFRHKRNHMAIVVDEYGGVSGLITIEDVLEQIVGSIVDEYDSKSEGTLIQNNHDGSFTVDALTPTADFNEFFATKFDADASEIISGEIIKIAAKVPQAGYVAQVGDLEIKVSSANLRRILKLQVTPKK
jgi:magnesium and cobalt transporter